MILSLRILGPWETNSDNIRIKWVYATWYGFVIAPYKVLVSFSILRACVNGDNVESRMIEYFETEGVSK